MVMTVHSFDVEHGDRLIGCGRRRVDEIVFRSGRWSFYADGRLLRSASWYGRVQVVRSLAVDDTPPHGIARPLQLINGGMK